VIRVNPSKIPIFAAGVNGKKSTFSFVKEGGEFYQPEFQCIRYESEKIRLQMLFRERTCSQI
jgi:hypothetical protein